MGASDFALPPLMKKTNPYPFSHYLQKQVLLLDGAMGTMIQALNLTDSAFGGSEFKMLSDLLTFSRPQDLKNIHLCYLEAGAHILETNTFGASPLRLGEYDFRRLDLSDFPEIPYDLQLCTLSHQEMAYFLSKVASEIACSAVAEYQNRETYDQRPLFVAGSIGPSNWVLSSTHANLKRGSFRQIQENFFHQILGLLDGGVDLLLFETQQDILELKAAIFAAHQAFKERQHRVPIIAQVTVDAFSKMQIFNTDIHSALVTVEGLGIDVFGINCSIGPDLMVPTVERLSKYASIPLSVVPNAGLPVSEEGQTVFKFKPEDSAHYLKRFVKDFGVSLVGGCCGTTPAHIRAIARELQGEVPVPRQHPQSRRLYLSGPQNAVRLDGSENLILIGERLNVRGSNKVRDAVETQGKIDEEAIEEVVQEQVRDLGLDIIDVCMDSNIVDTPKVLPHIIQSISHDFKAAMSIDSFDVQALKNALECYSGRPILNSISLEEYAPGIDKIDAVLSFAEPHCPVYIALLTDTEGPAVTAEAKLKLAQRIVDKTSQKYQVHPSRLLIDVNAFPLGSESQEGMNFALESIRSIPLIKKIHPDLKTSIGIGNLTNGLAKKPYMRKVLTSVFLDEARKVGLDAAIINPNHYVPVSSLDPKDYALGLQVILKRDMEAFTQLEEIAERKKGNILPKRTSYEALPLEESISAKILDGYKERSTGSLTLEGHSFEYQDKIVLQVAQALKRYEPLDFINNYLMKAMKELGDGFGKGDVSLPHLLKSADVMKHAMSFLEQYMKAKAGIDIHSQIQYKATVVLGTVYQDVHSIGKDLTKTLLENYGYRVLDLGVQVPLQKFIDTAKEYQAQVIGMSALLVQTSNHMITLSKMLLEQNLGHLDLLIGGAPVNHRHAGYVAMAGGEDIQNIRSNVFYCPTGMDGVNILNQLCTSESTALLLKERNKDLLVKHYQRAKKQSAEQQELLRTLPRRQVSFELAPPFSSSAFCSPQKIEIPLSRFKEHLDRKTLYSLNWKYGGKNSWEKKGTSWEKLSDQLDDWIERSEREGWLSAQGVLALYPCKAQNDEVIVYDPHNLEKELERFRFDVVVGQQRQDIFSAAQYFRPFESDSFDFIGLQLATAGKGVEQALETFKKAGDSESCLYLQGLSDRIAEDMADYLHQLLRKKRGLSKEGTRYSPGYPALTDLENNLKIFRQLQADHFLGVSLTSAWEFSPTGSTAAIVCFHPEATYQ
jgi:5-methyltetrahydrofolate--homocysteine methyltransferase